MTTHEQAQSGSQDPARPLGSFACSSRLHQAFLPGTRAQGHSGFDPPPQNASNNPDTGTRSRT
jgi:hypothetical protein